MFFYIPQYPPPILSIQLPVISMYLQADCKNSMHLDPLASEKPADLDLYCFQKGYIRV